MERWSLLGLRILHLWGLPEFIIGSIADRVNCKSKPGELTSEKIMDGWECEVLEVAGQTLKPFRAPED